MHVKQKEPDQVGSGQVQGGQKILVGSALVVNSGPFSSQSGLDMTPIYCGPGRGRGGEKKANITEPASGGLELAVIYPMAHVKVRAGGSPQPSPFLVSCISGVEFDRLLKRNVVEDDSVWVVFGDEGAHPLVVWFCVPRIDFAA